MLTKPAGHILRRACMARVAYITTMHDALDSRACYRGPHRLRPTGYDVTVLAACRKELRATEQAL